MNNLAFWDGIPWSELSNVVTTIVDVPPQLVTEAVLARDAVNAAPSPRDGRSRSGGKVMEGLDIL